MPPQKPRAPRVLITLPFCLATPGGMTSDCLHLAHALALALALAGVEVLLLPVATHDWDRFPRSRWSEEQLGSGAAPGQRRSRKMYCVA